MLPIRPETDAPSVRVESKSVIVAFPTRPTRVGQRCRSYGPPCARARVLPGSAQKGGARRATGGDAADFESRTRRVTRVPASRLVRRGARCRVPSCRTIPRWASRENLENERARPINLEKPRISPPRNDGDRIAVVPSARRHFSPHPVARPMSGPMSPARPGETVDLATRRAAAVAMSPRAVWKAIEPDFDRTPQMSFSQEKMATSRPRPAPRPRSTAGTARSSRDTWTKPSSSTST